MFTSIFFIIGGQDVVKNAIADTGLGANGVFLLFLILVFVLGIFIDWLGVSMILVPIFMPLLTELGFNPLQVAIITLVMLQTSFLTPPFSYTIFYIMAIAPPGVRIEDAYRGVPPFICIQLVVVVICILFPKIITFLPGVMLRRW
jgi:TRAP-type mannitol/chloroaromatic compound transport system permease large subunit